MVSVFRTSTTLLFIVFAPTEIRQSPCLSSRTLRFVQAGPNTRFVGFLDILYPQFRQHIIEYKSLQTSQRSKRIPTWCFLSCLTRTQLCVGWGGVGVLVCYDEAIEKAKQSNNYCKHARITVFPKTIKPIFEKWTAWGNRENHTKSS